MADCGPTSSVSQSTQYAEVLQLERAAARPSDGGPRGQRLVSTGSGRKWPRRRTPCRSDLPFTGGMLSTPRQAARARTARHQAAFLEAFVELGAVETACRRVGVGRRTVYDWAAHDVAFAQRFRRRAKPWRISSNRNADGGRWRGPQSRCSLPDRSWACGSGIPISACSPCSAPNGPNGLAAAHPTTPPFCRSRRQSASRTCRSGAQTSRRDRRGGPVLTHDSLRLPVRVQGCGENQRLVLRLSLASPFVLSEDHFTSDADRRDSSGRHRRSRPTGFMR